MPRTFAEYTRRRVLTSSWVDGEKLSQSQAADVLSLVNVGVVCYLQQLLSTGLFMADPHVRLPLCMQLSILCYTFP